MRYISCSLVVYMLFIAIVSLCLIIVPRLLLFGAFDRDLFLVIIFVVLIHLGDNIIFFCDFLFALLHTKPILEKCLLM